MDENGSEHGGLPRVLASKRNWVNPDAVTQLSRVATLPSVVSAIGLPDLHPGRGVPIGMAVATDCLVYPHLVGNDIGCGMGLWQTNLPSSRRNLDRWIKKLGGLESAWGGDATGWLVEAGLQSTSFDASLGTIGGGNHFAELQMVHEIRETPAFEQWRLCKDSALLLVHSGSRGLGQAILQSHLERTGTAGLPADGNMGREYLARHQVAVLWARTNRALIAERFLSCLNCSGQRVLDSCHNSITAVQLGDGARWLHRKEVTPSDQGPIVVPGSRGSATYLCQPLGDQSNNLFSLAHGAGRKWARGEARGRLEQRCSPASLTRTALGSRVICEDRDLLYEEAPQAYKNVEVVVQDMVDMGLLRVIAVLHPLITYKTRIVDQ